MSARKRPLSGISAQDAPALKMAKANTNNSWRDLYELEFKIPSADKASQNDWKTLASAHLKIHAIINGNPVPQLTDQKRIIYGNVHDRHMPETGKLDCIGSCASALIRRDQIRYNFHSDIGETNEEASVMGFGLFDRYGRLKPVFKKDSARSGSGIWGDELDRGDIFLIERVSIDKRYRRQGLGQEMVRVMLQKALAKCNPQTFVAIARPAGMFLEIVNELKGKNSEEKSAIYGREGHAVECFWRSLGFRRIGYTEWFAFLPGNAQHACHSLPASEDFDPPRPASAHMPNIIFTALLEAFDTGVNDTARMELTQVALESYGPEEDIWISADRKGNTLLHHAATYEEPACVNWIIEKCPRLVTIRNHQRKTPLDACREHLEVIRTRQKWMTKTVAVSDKFTGYSQPYVEILCTLKGLSNLSLEELLRLKYGCTCGQCQEGFLSPRMRFTLDWNAEMTAAIVGDEIVYTDGDLFLEKYEDLLMYLPPRVYNKMRTDFNIRVGFVSLFSHFVQCLRDSTEPPRELKILEMVISAKKEEESTMAKHYLDFGGTVEAVGSALFRSVLGDTQSAGLASIWSIFAAKLRALPACRNDEEFAFVSGMCGYERVRRGRCLSATGHLLDEYDF